MRIFWLHGKFVVSHNSHVEHKPMFLPFYFNFQKYLFQLDLQKIVSRGKRKKSGLVKCVTNFKSCFLHIIQVNYTPHENQIYTRIWTELKLSRSFINWFMFILSSQLNWEKFSDNYPFYRSKKGKNSILLPTRKEWVRGIKEQLKDEKKKSW